VIETQRLRLRRLREDDRETVSRWNADPVFTEHLGGVHSRARSDEVFDRWLRHWQEHGFGVLAVEWSETGELVGRAGPQFHSFWPHDPEVGWGISPAWQGRGLATEAGAAAIAWAFGDLGFDRVASITTEGNTASLRVMAKLGFRLYERVPSGYGELLVHVLDRDRGPSDGIEVGEATARASRPDPQTDRLHSRARCHATGPSVSRSWARPSSAPRPPATHRIDQVPSSAGSSWPGSSCSRSS